MDTMIIPKDYEGAVKTLAAWHSDADDPEMRIIAFPDPGRSVVRLLELSTRFPSAGGNLRAVSFGKSNEFPFPSAVILAEPGDWPRIKRREIELPEGWELDGATVLMP